MLYSPGTPFNKPHFCDSWTGMFVTPGTPEIESCRCSNDTNPLKPGDRIFTEGRKRIVVRKVEYIRGTWVVTDTEGDFHDAKKLY